MSTKKILFATNYSDRCQRGLLYAASLARESDAILLIVHVSPAAQQPAGEAFDEGPATNEAELAELEVVKPLDAGIHYEHRLLHGEPAEQIVKLASQEQVDAIVLGTGPRSQVAARLLGSVAEAVLRSAKCRVITHSGPAGVPAAP